MPLYQRLAEPQGVGHLFMVLRVDAFEALAAFTHRVDETIRRIRNLPRAAGVERIYLPGEHEHLRALEYQARGIPLPADAVGELERIGQLLGAAVPAARTTAVAGN